MSATKTLRSVASLTIAATLLLATFATSSASAAFGIAAFDGQVSANPAGDPFTQAGGHPYAASTDIDFNTTLNAKGDIVPDGGGVRNVDVDLPAGFAGNPQAASTCSFAQFVSDEFRSTTCRPESQVGISVLRIAVPGVPFVFPIEGIPVYKLESTPGSAALFGFKAFKTVAVFGAGVRNDGDYGLRVSSRNIPEPLIITGTSATFWGTPSADAHDSERACQGADQVPAQGGPTCDSNLAKVPLLTNPTACTPPGVGLESILRIEGWDGGSDEASFFSHLPPNYPDPAAPGPQQGPTGCEEVPFDPEISLTPTSQAADSPTGLDVELSIPTDGLLNPDGIAQSNLKKTVVTLPDGMSVNPSSASGLGSCSPAQLANEKADSPPGAGCPNDSKIGTVEVETPLLEESLDGSVFLAKQNDNPFDSLLALYIVVKSPERGVVVKLSGKVSPDPNTGRLITTFDDNPQLPFSNLHLQIKGGPRAPLITPPSCGTYATQFDLSPWARPESAVNLSDSFQVSQGPDGGPCPSSGQFDPGFEAGTATPIAGDFSPLIVKASRPDGSQVLKGLSLDLPPGLTGKLAGVQSCSDGALAAAAGKSGLSELASPSCPAASKVGTVDVGAGAGSTPFHVQGTAYLTGPYKGAPLSLAVITPAVAGPFDLGTVVVRAKANVDPKTAQIHVASDPIPTILQGIPLHVRSVNVDTNRPEFTLNPTSCDPMSFGGTLFGISTLKPVSNRFQVGACNALGFKPRLNLKLKGGTHRGDHPKLRATLTQPEGQANIARAQVTLPRSAFLDQAHIKTVCTRVQFAADACPKGSVYGKAKAITPLLDNPLSGPVYLRSSDNTLPDLVAVLRGPASQPIEIELSGRTDSVKGALRNTFDLVPDAPVSKFVLELFGGKRGLVVNSREICAHRYRATVKLDAQSGKESDTRPRVQNSCGKGRRGKKR